ncbi:hypothetical protein MCBG_02588 [Micromonospora sp. M42]|nr:hypothetical protein MCBG_02588 [Micromonospora sp. M42]
MLTPPVEEGTPVNTRPTSGAGPWTAGPERGCGRRATLTVGWTIGPPACARRKRQTGCSRV